MSKENLNVKARLSRREFIKIGSLAGAVVVSGGIPASVLAAEKIKEYKPLWKEGEDVLLRIQDDVNRAMSKPVEQRAWSMAIDVRKCVGCHACTVACKSENVTPPDLFYRHVIDKISGKYPKLSRVFVPVLCNHCEKPPCVPVCPADATHKRADGIVDIDYEKCIGCGLCVKACPYSSRTIDSGKFYTEGTPRIEAYEMRPNFEYNKEWKREEGTEGIPPMDKARKCHFCMHRIENGVPPACVTTCIGRATIFGDLNDEKSLVAELVKNNKTVRLKSSLGTKPRVYYVGLKEETI